MREKVKVNDKNNGFAERKPPPFYNVLIVNVTVRIKSAMMQ